MSDLHKEFKKLWEETMGAVSVNEGMVHDVDYVDSVLAMKMARIVLESPSRYSLLYGRVRCRSLAGFYRFFRWVLESPWVLHEIDENSGAVREESCL